MESMIGEDMRWESIKIVKSPHTSLGSFMTYRASDIFSISHLYEYLDSCQGPFLE
jgi:hypothetical protein